MKHFLFFILFAVCTTVSFAQNLLVVDEDNTPIPSACVFDRDDAILGITDTDGKFSLENIKNYPLVVKSAGMEDTVVEKPTDKVKMNFRLLELPDVIFTPKDRPVMHIVAYSTEISSLIANNDTAVTYSEYMVDYFVAVEKCKFKSKLNPRVRNVRRQILKTLKADNDSIEIEPFSFGSMPMYTEEFEEHKNLVGDKTGTEKKLDKDGKVINMWKKTPATYMEYTDLSGLLGTINTIFLPLRLTGITVKATGADMTIVFENNKTKKHSVQDLVQQTTNMKIKLGGRKFRNKAKGVKEFDIKLYTETYPVSRTYLSEEGANIALRDTSKIEFVIPDAAKK